MARIVLFSVIVIICVYLESAICKDGILSSKDSICGTCTCAIDSELERLNILCDDTKVVTDMENVVWPAYVNEDLYVYFNHKQMKTIQTIPLNPNIVHLSFDNNEIRTIWPNAFSKLENLKYLSLSTNALTEIQSDMFNNLPNLNELDLSVNQVTKFSNDGFPEMKSLSILRLNENRLEQIPGQFLSKLTNLQYLYIAKNKISYLDFKELSNQDKILNNIKVLDFSENSLRLVAKEHFSKTVSLQVLNLSHNEIETLDTVAFENCQSLISIDLSHNKIKLLNEIPKSVSSLFLAMNEFVNVPSLPTNLTILDLSNNEITDINAEDFEMFTNLQELNISKNHITNYVAVTKPLLRLSVLDLSYNSLSELPEFLSESILPELQDLYVDGNPMKHLTFKDEISLKRFSAKYMKELSSIDASLKIKAKESNVENSCIEIYISHNEKLNSIAENTFQNIKLCYLDLSFNDLKDLPQNAANWSDLRERGVNLQGNPWNCQCDLQWILENILGDLYTYNPYLLHEFRCETPRQYRGIRFVHWYKWGERALCEDIPKVHRSQNYVISSSVDSSADNSFISTALSNNVVIILISCICVGIAIIIGLIVYLARGKKRHRPEVMQQINRRRHTPNDANHVAVKSNIEETRLVD